VLPQIFSLADSAANNCVSTDDLVQEACVEALRVLKNRFDPERNPYIRYWRYAQIFVRSAVRRATRRKGNRPLPHWHSWGDWVESPEDEVLSFLALRTIHWALATAISTLDERLQSIIYYSYGFFADPPPDSAIAAKYNISEERVRQLRASAIRQMRAKVAQSGVIGDRLREVARLPNAPQPSVETLELWRNPRLKPGATAPPPLPRERALDDPLWW
jgi:RNA polymerase sigma factor (sigma-70 family)